MGLPGQMLCIWSLALVVCCLSLAFPVAFLGPGLLWFVCLRMGLPLARSGLGSGWVGFPVFFRVSVLVCSVWCAVACLSGLGPAGGVAGLVSGGPCSFCAEGPVVVPVGVALSGAVVLLVDVLFCGPWSSLVCVLVVSLLLVGAWCRSVSVGCFCVFLCRLWRDLVVGPRGQLVAGWRCFSSLWNVGWWCGWTCLFWVCGGGGDLGPSCALLGLV